jgi:hypothetical protein
MAGKRRWYQQSHRGYLHIFEMYVVSRPARKKSIPLLGAFAKLRTRLLTASCLSVRLPICRSLRPYVDPHGTRLPQDWFSRNLIYLVFFVYISRKFKFNWTTTTITRTLHEYQHTFWTYPAQLFLEWEKFQTKVLEKIKTRILCPVTVFSKIVLFMR